MIVDWQSKAQTFKVIIFNQGMLKILIMIFNMSKTNCVTVYLQQRVELGEEIQNVQPHDVASLVKQFFRQLPEPLLTSHLHDCFIKGQRLEDKGDQVEAILLLCLLLPVAHLTALQFTMRFLDKVASCSQQSKMGTTNLAIVLTPNLIHNTKKEGNSTASEKQLKEQTTVIDILLKNADKIGLVSEDIYERAKTIGDELVDGMTSSSDELDNDNNLRRGSKRQSRQRTRSGSISGTYKLNRQVWTNKSSFKCINNLINVTKEITNSLN